MTLRFSIALATIAAFATAACGTDDAGHPSRVLRGNTMGTTFSIEVASDSDDADREPLGRRINDLLGLIDRRMSTYLADSEVSLLNDNMSTDWQSISAMTCEAFADAQAFGHATNGAFDVTVGRLVELWGFGSSGVVLRPPAPNEVEGALRAVGYRQLETDCLHRRVRKLHPEIRVDLSAYAKGYAVDAVAELLSSAGVDDFLVEIGGELRVKGLNANGEPWSVAIERPSRDGRRVQTMLRLTDAAVATSGDYRNYFEHDGVRYSHTIDPRTGRPVKHEIASVTVIAKRAAQADAVATAMLVMGPQRGLAFAEREHIAAYFLLRDGDRLQALSSSWFEFEHGAQTAR